MDKSSFENLCRLCVQKSNCFMHIDFVQPNDKKPINEVLNYVYDLQVVADDGLPEYICYDCHLKLKEFEKYKMKVHSAKIELMRLKGKVVNTTVIGRVQEDEVEAENHSPPDEDNNNRLQVYIKQEETEGDVYLASEGEQIEEPSQDVVSQASNPSSYLSSSKDTSADGASSSNEMQIKEEEIEIHDSLPSEDNQINASSEVEVANFQKKFICECAICGMRFTSKYRRQLHIAAHSESDRYKCRTCGKMFEKYCYLRKHNPIHEDERKFGCADCGKQFRLKQQLKEHVRVHTGEQPYACEDCGRRFSQIGNLKTHLLIHKDEKAFHCKECGKSFVRRDQLKIHQNIHADRKGFECPLCKRKFNHLHSLKRHLLIHSRNKEIATL